MHLFFAVWKSYGYPVEKKSVGYSEILHVHFDDQRKNLAYLKFGLCYNEKKARHIFKRAKTDAQVWGNITLDESL